ncbi:MAG: M20/M25/M40 family metallo-hydrolase [Bacteroidales bacterium]
MKNNFLYLAITLLLLLCTPLWAKRDSLVTSPASLLSSYIQIESVSGEENEAAYFISKVCRDAGLIVEYISDHPGAVNFCASLYPLSERRPNILFHTHIDVVPAGDFEGWSYPPFGGVVDKGRVWGRGSMDNKGLGIIEFFALKSFVERALYEDLPYNVTILFVSGEETGGATGSAIVVENFFETLNPYLLIGEGGAGTTELLGSITKGKPLFGISIAEKESLWLKLSWESSSAGHASIADDSNAIATMVRDLNTLINSKRPIIITDESALMMRSLGKVIGGVKGRLMQRPNSPIFKRALNFLAKKNSIVNDLFTNKITLSSFGANSTAINQSSAYECAYLDTRALPGVLTEDIVDFIAHSIKNPDIKIEPLSEIQHSKGTVPEYFFNLMASAIKEEFEGASVIPMLLPASTDNNFYRSKGIPVYGINPMLVTEDQLNSIHNFDEFIKIEDLESGIRVFKRFIESVQRGATP